ncbi:hypothetical protein FGIG_03975 [Fasciola gigantica]|uniref:Uncharacterized protein n=1 Tax=Fasciola gigantica TaxID=46835 RepID=A0A504YYU8_FASGI|nr:hypothetical protein FGIG_03975 [Fasciola gigantica]
MEPVFESCWAFLVAIHCLELLRHRNSTTAGNRDGVSSVNFILFAAFGPHATQKPCDVPSSSSETIYQPWNNVLLRGHNSVENPIARPLALLADLIYTYINSPHSGSGQKARTKSSESRAPSPPVCHALVDLWLTAFMHLTRLGYLLQLWLPDGTQTGKDSHHMVALRSIESAIHACASSTRTNLAAFGLSIHKHMHCLLSTHQIYTEIYVAMGQILTGLFKLIRRPNKATYASSMLANFLRTQEAKQQACVLYTHAVVAYLRDGWPQLATQTRLRLACCLRGLIEEMKRRKLCSDSALHRYLHCSLALSCADPAVLNAVTKSYNVSPETKPDYALPLDGSVPLDQLTSPNFWWSQCGKVLRQFPPDHLWECTQMTESPFKLVTVELNEASEHGVQVITITVEMISHVSFIARISAVASQPRSDDWYSIMDYGHVTQILRHLSGQSSSSTLSSLCSTDKEADVPGKELVTVELKRLGSRSEYHSEPRTPMAPRSSVDLTRIENMSQMELTVPQTPSVTKSTEELGMPDVSRRRKSSFLDVAASWATRPAWKSQEQLNQKPESVCQPEDRFPKLSLRNRLPLSPIESPGPTVPDRSHSIGASPCLVISPLLSIDDPDRQLMRRSTSSEPRTGFGNRTFSFVEFGPNTSDTDATEMAHPLLTDYRPTMRIQNQSAQFFIPHPTQTDLIRLNPGLNRVSLISQSPGFLIPGDVRISLLNRVNKGHSITVVDEHNTSSDIPLHLVFRVQAQHFHSSWSNYTLLESLLPKVHVIGQMQPMNSIRVILGLRCAVDLEFETGKLDLPDQPEANISLYRIVHRLNHEPRGPVAPTSGPARVLKVVNDYRVSPVVVGEGERRGTKARITVASQLMPNDYRCELLDGPVELVPVVDESENGKTSQQKRFRLSKPLWIRSFADKDEFAISMPSGYLHRLPVDIIRPLALTLSVNTFQKTDKVVFAIRIACMDLHDNTFQMTSPLKQPNLKPDTPLTFRLSKCHLLLTAPNVPDSIVAKIDPNQTASNGRSPDSSSTTETAIELKDAGQTTNGTDVARVKEMKKARNSMTAIPVDPRNMEVVVNRLCPVTLLWHLKFDEFRQFVNFVLKRFSEPPEARFQCTFARLDDPTCESQLSFNRRISPIRHPVGEKPPSLSGLLIRSRKERGSS